MFKVFFSALLMLLATYSFAVDEKAGQLAQRFLIVDTHIDVPRRLEADYEDVTRATLRGDFDYPRARAGGLNIPFMSIFIPWNYEQDGGGKAMADRLIDRVEALVGRAPDKFAIPHSVAEARQQAAAGLISLALGMENGTPLEGDLDNLAYFHGRGIRYITLAHSRTNHIADSSYDENRHWNGLSPFGQELVPAMNEMGVMIDVSHISDEAFGQVMDLSAVPVIASHSSARAFTPGFERNMSDDMIKRLAEAGGVIHINFGSDFLTREAQSWSQAFKPLLAAYMKEKRLEHYSPEVRAFMADYRAENPYPFAGLETVLDHIDHVVGIGGVGSVGIGSDYDGVGDTLPVGLKDVASYPKLVQGLLDRGYGEADIEKILGANLLRVWAAVEAYADRRQYTRTAE